MALDKLTTIQTSGIVATGIVTSNSYVGDGSGLTGVVGSGSGVVVQDDTSVVGTAGTIDFGTALDVSAISSGIVTVTASGGSGSIAGIDTTATSIFSTLDIGADIDVDGHTELDNINIAGVTTFAGNIDANADIDIDGHTNLDNVSIAGVTTFSEDVKFDGATAGRDITFDRSINRLHFADSADAVFGNSNDLIIQHTGAHSFVQHTGTGHLQILGNNIFLGTGSGSKQHIAAYNNNRVDLYFNNSVKITTTNTGAVVTGILTATSFVGDGSGLTNLPGGGSYGNSDVDTHLNRSSASSGEILSWNGSDYAWVADNVGSGSTAEVRSNTLTVSGVSTFTGNIDANGSLDIDGHTDLDNVSIAGITTFTNSAGVGDFKPIQLEKSGTTGASRIQFLENGTNKGGITYSHDNNRVELIAMSGNDIVFYSGGNLTTRINSSGHVVPGTDSQHDLGLTGTRWRNVYADTLYGDGSNLTGVTGSIAGISTTGTSNFANIQLIGITTGLNVSGVLTAAQFSGDGANLTSLPAAQLSGTAAAINGSNITNLAAANLSGTLPALDGSALTGIAVTEAPITNFTVTANGSSAYRFAGGGVNSSSDDPDLYLVRGQKYRFNNTTGSNHPFRFRESSGGSTYSSGVSGSENGVQFFMVPLDAPAQLVYQCTIHSGMVGNIYIRGAGGHNNNVGFTTFSNKIEVQSSSNTTATFKGSGGAGFINITDGDDGTLVFLGVDGGTFKVQTSGSSYSDKLVITSNGDVRIGSGNPATFGSGTTVHETYNANTYVANLVTSGTRQLQMIASQTHGTTSIGTRSNHQLNLCVNDSTKASITTSGQLLIARTTASSYGNLLETKSITVETNGDTTGMHFNRTDSNAAWVAMRFYAQGSQSGYIQVNTSSTTYSTSSDYRLKENVVSISDGIARLKTLKPYKFNFIEDATKTVDGFFAHEVTAVPEAVSGEKDAVDEDGNPDYQVIDHSKLVPLLTAALQEEIVKREEIEAKYNALEARISALEGS